MNWSSILRSKKVIYITIGLPLGVLFTSIGLLRYPAWLFSSIIHEAGHTLYALFVGCPALPGIRLDGHAATVHGEQMLWLTLIVWAALGYLAWLSWRTYNTLLRFLGMSPAVLYPLLAYHEPTREVTHLLSGHLGELVFAGVFFWRSATGWYVGGSADRAANSMIGWYLVLSNAYLAYGLVYLPSIRKWYFSSGSFGLTNDYLRVAHEWLRADVSRVAWPMFLVSLAVLPLSLLAARGVKEAG